MERILFQFFSGVGGLARLVLIPWHHNVFRM
jgi:hypothetical protein